MKSGKVKLRHTNCHHRYGVTLIEMVITTSIIGIIITIGAVYYHGTIEKIKLEKAAETIQSDLITYQRLAHVEAKNYTFDFTNNNYYFVIKEGYQGKVHDRKLPQGITIIKTTFRRRIPGKNRVTFYPSGAPSSGGTITLQNNKGNKKYIIVSPFWGVVRIDDKPP